MRKNLASLELGVIMAELKAYVGEHIDRKPGLVKLMRGACACRRNAKETKDWDAIKIQLKPSLVQEMLGIDVTDVSDRRSGGGRTQRRQWPALISTNCSIQLQSLSNRWPSS